MSNFERPRRLRLPRSRALTCDVLHYHRRVPSCAHDRHCHLGRVAELRSQSSPRISWSLLFTKAYALMAQRRPVLRQSWLGFPWPHLYQHSTSVGMLAIQREFRGEPWLFWGRFTDPEHTSLPELQQRLNRYLHGPVDRVFRRQLQFSALPTPVRRLIWWGNLNLSGGARARRTGTFFLTTLAGQGAEIQHPPSFQTGCFTYGPLDAAQNCRVTLAYDHRLTDGLQIAHCLRELEETLNGQIADELRDLQANSSRHAA